MANTFKNASVIVQEAALQLYNALRLGKKVHRYASNEFANKGSGMPGPTINIPMPIRYLASAGPTLVPQSIIERTIPVVMNQDFHVGLDMTVFDMTLNTDDDITKMSSKFIQPAIQVLADKVDDYIAGLALKLHNATGAAGVTPGSGTLAETLQLLANTERIMTEAGIPDTEERCLFLDPKASGYLPISLAATFVREAQQTVSKGRIGGAAGFEIYRSNNVRTQTAGGGAAFAAGAVTNGVVGQVGSVINIDGLNGATDTLYEGDIITFGAVGTGPQPVNVSNKRVIDRLQQFVVTATTVESGSAMAVPISPAIVTTGAYQNVNIAVADGLAVTRVASHKANMAIIKDTLCLATMPLKAPKSAVVAETATFEGITLLLTAAYDITNRREIARIDIIFGGRELYPETGVRLLG